MRDDGGAISSGTRSSAPSPVSLEIYITLGGIAGLVSLLNDRSKRLGDLLAGTYASTSGFRRRRSGRNAAGARLGAIADVARLPDRPPGGSRSSWPRHRG